MDRSEAERRAAEPPADQAEAEGKCPSGLAGSQRDKKIRELLERLYTRGVTKRERLQPLPFCRPMNTARRKQPICVVAVCSFLRRDGGRRGQSPPLLCSRHSLGETPYRFLNAREKWSWLG